MLLGIRIKKISRFDIEKSKKEIGDILKALEEVEANLKQLTRYSVRYLKNLMKKYGDEYPRLTKVTSFKQVELREVTASECRIAYDAENGYYGYDVKGEVQFECSSLDKIIMVWKDGRYKMMPPPDKFFVGKDLEYAALFDRDKVMTTVYTASSITYMKKFTFGGCIQNKEYRLAPDKSRVLLFDDTQPEQIYVKYKPAPKQRINQQIFNMAKLTAKSAKAKGNQMTMKKINNLATKPPRNWDDSEVHETSAELMDF
jgi:topoisomerase-4 subunit A